MHRNGKITIAVRKTASHRHDRIVRCFLEQPQLAEGNDLLARSTVDKIDARYIDPKRYLRHDGAVRRK